MGNSFFDDYDVGDSGEGFQPIYNGRRTDDNDRRVEKVESKEGRVVLNGKDIPMIKIDRLATYGLILGILSIFCVLFDNGYLISMLALLMEAKAINSGTKRKRTVNAAVACCVIAIVLYIFCIAVKPLLADMHWYQVFIGIVDKYWPL